MYRHIVIAEQMYVCKLGIQLQLHFTGNLGLCMVTSKLDYRIIPPE